MDSLTPQNLKELTIAELNALCAQIRQLIIQTVSSNGGHLSSNLGAVELTVALHYVFDNSIAEDKKSPTDKFIFDVGHQSYTHKILTGRADQLTGLRQKGGLSGFTRRSESKHDTVSSGHASVSISTALGLLKGQELLKEKGKVIAVIGDGSIANGTAFEALNHAGQILGGKSYKALSRTDKIGNNLIIILNDNEMSIDENVGALHDRFHQKNAGVLRSFPSKLIATKGYQTTRKNIEHFFDTMPFGWGEWWHNLGERCKKALKGFFFHETIFSELGFEYVGPIDGHNLKDIIKILRNVTKINRPTVIHLLTKKGKGYRQAENLPNLYHGVAPFNLKQGITNKNDNSFSSLFGSQLTELAAHNKKIVAITAAMCNGTGLAPFKKLYPNRFFDVGIAEGHAVTFAGGLALGGLKPVLSIYSTFMQRAVDHFIHDLAMQGLNTVIALDRAGLVAGDGESHQGIFDIALFKAIPNTIFLAPATGNELKLMLAWAFKQRGKAVLMRYPKATLPSEESGCEEDITLGNGVFVRKNGGDVLIISVGAILSEAIEAVHLLNQKKIKTDIYNLRFISPINEKEFLNIIKPYKLLVVIEEGVKVGGIGESLNLMQQQRRQNVPFLHLAVANQFLAQASREELLKLCGLDAVSLTRQIQKFYQEHKIRSKSEQLKKEGFKFN